MDLLVKANSWCGYLNELVHAAHRTEPHAPGHGSRLLAALVANGCNFGHATMARIAGFSPDELAWTHNWYLRNRNPPSRQHPHRRLPDTATHHPSLGQRHPLLIRRATIPHDRQQPPSPTTNAQILHRFRGNHLHLDIRPPRPTKGVDGLVVWSVTQRLAGVGVVTPDRPGRGQSWSVGGRVTMPLPTPAWYPFGGTRWVVTVGCLRRDGWGLRL